MRWSIKEFKLADYVWWNKSSRKLLDKNPAQGKLSLSGSLEFGEVELRSTGSAWIKLTNVGSKALFDLAFLGSNEFSYYGTIPAHLLPGDWFQIKLKYRPTLEGERAGTIAFTTFQQVFSFPYTASVPYVDLHYDGTALYNNKQKHNAQEQNG